MINKMPHIDFTMITPNLCDVTHAELSSGGCPWCDHNIIHGIVEASEDATLGAPDRVWNLEVLKDHLSYDSKEVRKIAVTNIYLFCVTRDTLPLLCMALQDRDNSIREYSCFALAKLGRDLELNDAAHIEEELQDSGNQLALRLVLVNYFRTNWAISEKNKIALRNHRLWFIENYPDEPLLSSPEFVWSRDEDYDGYNLARQLWLMKVRSDPQNSQLLKNASAFLLLSDSDTAKGMLEGIDEVATPQDSSFDRTCGDLTPLDLAKSAYEAGEFEKAKEYAIKCLSYLDTRFKDDLLMGDGDIIHYANIILGRIALAHGDVEQAKSRLLASAKTTGSPSLCSFGPNMKLAEELLRRGEQIAVVKYIELCSRFWTHHSGMLDAWRQQIEFGRVPDFGANLHY